MELQQALLLYLAPILEMVPSLELDPLLELYLLLGQLQMVLEQVVLSQAGGQVYSGGAGRAS